MKRNLVIIFVLLPLINWAQDSLTMNDAITVTLANNKRMQAATQQVLQHERLRRTTTELPKTEVSFMYGQYNSIVKDNNITLMQTIPFPTAFASKRGYLNAQLEVSKSQKTLTENELTFQVKALCIQAYYLYGKKSLLIQQDSIFRTLRDAITKKFMTGEETKLELTKAQARLSEIQNLAHQTNADIKIIESSIQALLNSPNPAFIKNSSNIMLSIPNFDSVDAEVNPVVQVFKYQSEAAAKLKSLERARTLPDFKIGYFNQTLTGFQKINGQDQYFGKDKRFTGLQAGISIPLWFFPQAAQVKSLDYASKKAEAEFQQSKIDWWAQLQKYYQQAMKNKSSLEYYLNSGLPLAKLIQQQALKSYKQGEISITEMLPAVNQAIGIQESYLNTLMEYNHSIINIEFLIGQKS
jgi:cobalt-zinc-cadmium resistance protein CzcA